VISIQKIKMLILRIGSEMESYGKLVFQIGGGRFADIFPSLCLISLEASQFEP
jgi:hypothetical protein